MVSDDDVRHHWRNDDDYRMSLAPAWLDGYWDHPRNPVLRSLIRMVARNRLPRLSVFAGPMGSGKTIAAYHLACAASCDKYDPESHRPCGECTTCQNVLYGKTGLNREGLLEIDAADRDGTGASTVLTEIGEAFTHTTAWRTSKPGNPKRDYIVFIDEAHRMTPMQREVLLKKVERWPGAHIILATTRLEKLGVDGESKEGNPLVSRAEVFDFTYPTHDECVAGVIKAAKTKGVVVEADVAAWMTHKHERCPRDILGELYRLSTHGSHIKREVVIEEYGAEAWMRWSAGSNDQIDLGDDDGFVMV